MRLFIVAVVILSITFQAKAQVVISGYVNDCVTGERLIGANIYEVDSYTGTVTNAYGFFSLKIKNNSNTKLIFSYIGYKKQEVFLPQHIDTLLNICLVPGSELQEVKVTGIRRIEDRPEIGTTNLSLKNIKHIPALGGEPDVIKALQLLPGVQGGDEGKSGLYVRGGSPDQNLMLLDDVPLYYVNHLGGFVSTFNVDALSDVKIIKGGFPARYGSRLSSVVDVRMKEGNMKEFHGAGTLGLIAAKLMLEGPIIKDTMSYLISFRRFMYDLIMRPATYFITHGASMGYNFYDVNAKLNYKPNVNNRIYLSFYGGDDRLIRKVKIKEDDTKAKITNRWGNMLGALRWNHIFSPVLFANTTLTYTQYRYTTRNYNKTENTETESTFLSAIRDINGKIDFEYFPLNNYKIRFGANGILHKYVPTSTTYKQTINEITKIDTVYNEYTETAYEWNGYLENEFRLGHIFSANLGLRYSNYQISDTAFHAFEPRAVLNIKFLPTTSFKLSYSYMQQYIHLLTSSGAGMSVDYWVPSTTILNPEKSHLYSVGMAHTRRDVEFSIEGYYKTMQNLITFTEGVAYLSGSGSWQSKVDNRGEGTSYGVECFAQKKTGRLTGWVSYTWSETNRQFVQQNFGKPYPFKYDRRHNFNITASYKISDRINVAATWVFGTGNPVTLALSHHYVIDDEMEQEHTYTDPGHDLTEGWEYGSKNSFRMRSYHRLDVGINFTKKKRWGERTWNISIYNLYNRQNPYFYDLMTPYEAEGIGDWNDTELRYYQQSLFPFMPSISYNIKF
jgi:hypothetical protein